MAGKTRLLLIVSVAAALVLPCALGTGARVAADDTAGGLTVDLRYVPSKKVNRYPYETLSGKWLPVSTDRLGIEGLKGPITVIADKRSITVDIFGNGSKNVTIKHPGGFAMFPLESGAMYGLEFQNAGANSANWKYRRGGYVAGRLAGEQVVLIDDNSNGKYNDIGVDAVIVGKSKFASPLGKVLKAGKGFYEVEVSADGSKLTAFEQKSPTGILDMKGAAHIAGNIRLMVVTDGSSYFDTASFSRRGDTLPVGDYKLLVGLIEKGTGRCRVVPGKMEGIKVTESEPNQFEWGADPAKNKTFWMEFKCTRAEKVVTGHLNSLRLFGMQGEEYVNFEPIQLIGKFVIADRATGRPLARGETLAALDADEDDGIELACGDGLAEFIGSG